MEIPFNRFLSLFHCKALPVFFPCPATFVDSSYDSAVSVP